MALRLLPILLLLACLLPCLLPTLRTARAVQPPALSAPDNGENCPLQTVRHSAEVLTPVLELQAGEDGFVEMAITPAPGNDFYVSALADVLEKPQGARTEILPGFPKLRFRADTQGPYLLELRITLVSKSSCGGVKARELTREKVRIRVKQP